MRSPNPTSSTDTAEQANVKAALDQVVVTAKLLPGEQEVAATNKFAIYEAATDYLTPSYYETGGGKIFSQVKASLDGNFPLLHVSLHTPLYAVVNICPVDKEALVVPFGEKPPTPKCDADGRSTPSCSSVTSARCGCRRSWRSSGRRFCSSSACWAFTGGSGTSRSRRRGAQAEADRANAPALERIPEKV